MLPLPAKQGTFDASLTITFRPSRNDGMTRFIFHSARFTILTHQLLRKDGTPIQHTLDMQNTALVLQSSEGLQGSDEYRLVLEYNGKYVPAEQEGLVFVEYSDGSVNQ